MTFPTAELAPGAEVDAELAELQEAWAPAWSIWRARRSTDPPELRRGEFVASRMDDSAGCWPTVMCPTAAQMNAALREQRDSAGIGSLPVFGV